MLQAVPDALPPADRRAPRGRAHVPDVRHVITTGDKIPATSLAELPDLFPNARFYNIYGCTETNDSLMHEFLGLADGNVPTQRPGRPAAAGRHCARAERGRHSRSRATGTGELLVWTPFQTRGYLKTALNEEKFVSVADDGGRTFYRTGDIVRRHDDGTLTLEGRADFYVKVRGVRVSTQVVEQAIQEHPEVVEVAVVAVTDELAGARLHAVVRARGRLQAQQPRAPPALREQAGADGDAVDYRDRAPSRCRLTSTGKVDRKRFTADLERSRANG